MESDEQRRFTETCCRLKSQFRQCFSLKNPGEETGGKEQREKQEAQDFKVDALINRLRRDCENAEKVDAFAVDFCYVATAGAESVWEELLSPPN